MPRKRIEQVVKEIPVSVVEVEVDIRAEVEKRLDEMHKLRIKDRYDTGYIRALEWVLGVLPEEKVGDDMA